MEKVVLYKLEIAFLKIIPMVLAGCFLANTILSYFAIYADTMFMNNPIEWDDMI